MTVLSLVTHRCGLTVAAQAVVRFVVVQDDQVAAEGGEPWGVLHRGGGSLICTFPGVWHIVLEPLTLVHDGGSASAEGTAAIEAAAATANSTGEK